MTTTIRYLIQSLSEHDLELAIRDYVEFGDTLAFPESSILFSLAKIIAEDAPFEPEDALNLMEPEFYRAVAIKWLRTVEKDREVLARQSTARKGKISCQKPLKRQRAKQQQNSQPK